MGCRMSKCFDSFAKSMCVVALNVDLLWRKLGLESAAKHRHQQAPMSLQRRQRLHRTSDAGFAACMASAALIRARVKFG